MTLGTRLRIKRGDTAPAFRAQCQADAGKAPANLTGATARLLLRQHPAAAAKSLPLVVEDGAQGWVRRDWEAVDTAVPGSWDLEVEVTYADETVQTFPGSGYALLEVVPDLA